MLHDLVEKITDAETLQAYNRAVKELADSLRAAGEPDKAQKLTEIAELLHCSVKTIYNLRSSLKARLAIPEDAFQKIIWKERDDKP